MLHFIIAVVAFFCLNSFTSHANASKASVALTQQEVQLKGINSEAKFLVKVDARKDRKSRPKLLLSWRKSGLVASKKSTLTISVDGRTLQSVLLSSLDEGEHTFRLGSLEGGTHEINVRASLHIDDDPCLNRKLNDAWLAIEPSSNVNWTREVTATPKVPISDFPAAWQRLAQRQSGIQIELNAPLDPFGIGAYLDTDHLIRKWAYLPESSRSANTVGHIKLSTVDRLPATSAVVKRLTDTPSTRFVIEVTEDGSLSITAVDTLALREAILLLANDGARSLCTETICTGNLQVPRSQIKNANLSISEPIAPTQVWRLGQNLNSAGWWARGVGQHQMRFVWQRPMSWTIQEWPSLQLHAASSASANLDGNASVINVRINDRPVATYSLAKWQNGKAEIKVPKDLWSAGEWVFDISVNLQNTESKGCSISDQESSWVTISPDTALWVPRQEKKYEGIASFYAEGSKSNMPSLVVSKVDTAQLSAVAPALYPIASNQNNVGDVEQRWTIEDESVCSKKQCVLIKDVAPLDAPLKYSPQIWNDTTGNLRIPQISTQNTLGLFYIPPAKEHMSQLVIVAGPRAEPFVPIDPPDMTGLFGRIALFSEKWHILDIRSNGQESPSIITPDQLKKREEVKNISKQQFNLRWLNFVWAGLSVLVVGILLIRLWRKPAGKKIDENWEMHK